MSDVKRVRGGTFADRMERFVPDRGESCWEWTGYRGARGYGWTTINGVRMGAHRASYEFHVGPIPKGMWVLHSCDNPPCVNPAHLRAGTHRDNMDDVRDRARRKTHCPQGHPYSEENTYVIPSSSARTCITCRRARYVRKT